MRVLVHDYSGHPFQVQLSRSLAARGHTVLHVHCSSYATGKGAVASGVDDPDGFAVHAIDLGRDWDRYVWRRRVQQELRYGAEFTRVAARFGPDVVISSNDPLFAKTRSAAWCRRTGTPWVFWLQDIYSVAMARMAEQKLHWAGRQVGRGFQALERRLLHRAAMVVAITDDFLPLLDSWRIPPERRAVIENWAPLHEIPLRPQDNPWSRRHGLAGKQVVLYSGTLGLKHDPSLIVELAQIRRDDTNVAVVVISEGLGADWISGQVAELGLANLVVMPYQPWEDLPDVLATAAVLITLLERDAGVYSVPSKVLTYLCAGRPIVAAMPHANLGARVIERAGAGVVIAPDDGPGFVAAVDRFLADHTVAFASGARGRTYAEEAFDIDAVTDRFEAVIDRARRVP